MAYDGSIKIDTKIDTSGFSKGISDLKGIAKTGCAAVVTSLATVTAGITAAATASVKVGSSFEAAMSKVSAISGATGKDLEALTEKAKEMGAKTKFSASESAEALQYMAMAGWQTEDMLNGIDGIMSLAAADGLDLATTSDIVTDAITAFGLKASDSAHFADVLAKASSSANTNVSMLGESFKYVAPLAGTMGYSVEDVSLALGLMANASVKGSMAGTSLKTALSNLASPTDKMAEIMEKYGITISDAEGNALPLIDVLKQLREKFGRLSETEQTAAASTLFGKEAMSGMLAIINASDSDFKNLTDNINNADGAAQSMSDTMQDNLQGQITILKSALEGLGIEIYEGMQEPLKRASKEAQEYVNRLTDAFTNGGLEGMIEEAGNIFGELAVKASEAAPKMVDAAVGFLKSFVQGIANNSGKLITAAKQIVKTLVDNLVALLPVQIQKPVKECVNTLAKSFNSGGLKEAIKTISNILQNLGKVATNIAKAVLPPLAKAIDFVAKNTKILVPLVTAMFAAYKSYTILSSLTAIIKANTAATTAESLATAASTGTITLKQIAVGALTGQIGLATAAQYAWNLAMSLNPIGIVVAAVAALAAAIAGLTLATNDQSEAETVAAQKAAEEQKILEEKRQAYESEASAVESSIQSYRDKAACYITESDRAKDLVTELQSLVDENGNVEDANKSRVEYILNDLNEAYGTEYRLVGDNIDNYQSLTKEIYNTINAHLAQQLLQEKEESYATAKKNRQEAEQKRGEALLQLEKDKQKLQEANAFLKNREAEIDQADIVNKVLLQGELKGYKERVEKASEAVEESQKAYNDTCKTVEQYYSDISDYENAYRELSDGNYQKAISILTTESESYEKAKKEQSMTDDEILESRKNSYETAVIAAEQVAKDFNDGIKGVTEDMVKEARTAAEKAKKEYEEVGGQTIDGYISGADGRKFNLKNAIQGLFGNVTAWAKEILGIKSPSRVFKKIAGYTAEGYIQGLKSSEKAVKKSTDEMFQKSIPDKVDIPAVMKLKSKLNTDGLIGKMRAAVRANTAQVAASLTSKVVHDVNVTNDDSNKKYVLKGDVITHMDVNGREFAVATAPYMSEELEWIGG